MMGSMDVTPASVLVIESHPIMRTALCTAIAAETDLTVFEQETKSASRVQMVISLKSDDIFLTSRPDIILLAMGTPGVEELEALKALRKFLPETPILALTSNEVPEQEQAALEAGAQAVLTKAAPRAELIRVLQELGPKPTIIKEEKNHR
jgi:two-component system nitrate/nitrite response regulator NarL